MASNTVDGNPPRTILLDFDGTLGHYRSGQEEDWVAACAAEGILSLTTDSLSEAIKVARRRQWRTEEDRRQARIDMHRGWRRLLDEALKNLGHAPTDSSLDRIAARFLDSQWRHVELFEGVAITLTALAARGVRLGILTNGDARLQRKKLEHCGIIDRVHCVQIEGEAGVGKPEREAFERLLKSLNCSPEQAWMVGDDYGADVVGAKQAGLKATWISRSGAPIPADSPVQPDAVARSFTEWSQTILR